MLERDFWQGISILIKNYHVINKRLFACIINNVFKINNNINLNDENSYGDILKSIENNLHEICTESQLFEYLHEFAGQSCKLIIFQFKCIAKNNSTNIEALGIIDFANNSYTCKFDHDNFDDFHLHLKGDALDARILNSNNESSIYWLNNVLKSKLLKWCQAPQPAKTTSDHINLPNSSLQLVDVEQYAQIYKLLKSKHVATALQLWEQANESTDPLKFIHEDLAIAAYLIALWRRTSSEPAAFADLGCGNGLLVYILNAEGYAGYGFDIRRRKLWSLYPSTIKLLEHAIDPCDLSWLPKDVDWLIGNHSDELSAWLPVLAATSNFNMRYFLLPCCAFELSGAKFQRRNSRLSTFQDFYLYAQQLSAECGFETLQDRLKIPSTKRLALIGLQRTHNLSLYEQQKQHIWQKVAEERQLHTAAGPEIKLREKHEVVRNCTQLDKTMLDDLVKRIFLLLLNKNEQQQNALGAWPTGGSLSILEMAQQLTRRELLQIKAECGGLKTLLRNRHEIFECSGKDVYKIRYPREYDPTTANGKTIRKRMCFFQQHHPNGCPLAQEKCTFLHCQL